MILAATILAAVLNPTPTFCLGGECRPAQETRVEVAPQETARPFVWIAADVSTVIASVVPANASEVLLADETLTVHQVAVAPSDGARNLASAFELRCGDRTWKWSQARLAKQLKLMTPAGNCNLSVHADGYKKNEAALVAPRTTIALRRLPVISGSVIAAVTRIPVAGAEIFLVDGELLTTTDADGRFRVAIDRPWPARVRVEAIGYAAHVINVPKVIADLDLPIVLSASGSVVVTLAPPLGKESVRWEARRIIKDSDDEKVRSGEIAAGESTLTIDKLASGSYRILLLGEGSLQRVAVPVEVVEGRTVEMTMQIEPARLDLEVLRGGEPFGGAEVEFVFRDGDASWRSTVVVDAEGRKEEEIWQSGDYLAFVSSWNDSRRLDGSEEITWKMDLPDRVIRGRVLDAITGQPLADVPVSLESTSEVGMSLRTTRSSADGSYEFRMLRAGSYALVAQKDGYEDLRTPETPILEDMVAEKRDLLMQMASGPTVRAMNAAGMPMPAALVYVATPSMVRFAGVTKDDGRLSLPISAEERGIAYVVPRTGSFGMARFAPASESESKDVVIAVPDGNATLEVQAMSTEGEPIGGMSFLIRVDGILLPPAVKEALTQIQGWPMTGDAGGRLLLTHIPPGRYEIWPLASQADLHAVTSGNPPPAPVNVMLTPGHHMAQLTFKAKS